MCSRLVIQVIRTARAQEAQCDGALASHVNLLALLLLADSANKGGICWPSVASLARHSRLSPRSVRYALRALAGDGHITIEKRPGRNDRYSVHPGKACRATVARGATPTPDPGQPWQEVPPGRQEVPDTVAPDAHESSHEPRKEPSERSGSTNGQRSEERDRTPLISADELARMRKDPVAYWAAQQAADIPQGEPDA